MRACKVTAPMTHDHQPIFFYQKQILWKMRILSGRHRNIDEMCYAYDEVDLGLISGVIKCLHWETKWLRDSMIDEDFS